MREHSGTPIRPSRVVEQMIAFIVCQVILAIIALAQNLPVEMVLGWGLFVGILVLWAYNYLRKLKRPDITTKIYNKQADAAPDIIHEIADGKRLIRILCCSSTSVYPMLSATVRESVRRGLNIRILMVDPSSPSGRNSIENIARRENLKLSGEDYVKIIQEQIQKWLKLKDELRVRNELEGELTVGLYDHTPTYRGFVIDDSVAFIGHYYGATHGFDNPLFLIRSAFAKEFEKTWFSQFVKACDSMWEEAKKIQ